jgi:transketolase
MLINNWQDREKNEQVPTRNGFGEALVDAGKKDENIVVLCADLTESTRSHLFKEAYPERFVEVGVAEQNMMGVAAGMALTGKVPFVSSYATFSPGRNWDQLRVSVCYTEANVKVAGAHAGISVGPDGATHQALEDIAITRALPNMTVIVPADYHQTYQATLAAAKHVGPLYLRFAREKTPVFIDKDAQFEIGKAQVLREGNDVSIVACGPLVYEALMAAVELEKEGISVEVINSHTIKPLDVDTIFGSAQKTGAVVTVEEHQVTGGLGGAVAEALARKHPVPMECVGMQDTFGESGAPEELLEKYGMTSKDVVEAVQNVLKRK